MTHTTEKYEKKAGIACRQLKSDATEGFVLSTTAEENGVWVIADRSDSGEAHYWAMVSLVETYAEAVEVPLQDVLDEIATDAARPDSDGGDR